MLGAMALPIAGFWAALNNEWRWTIVAAILTAASISYIVWGYREDVQRHARVVLTKRSDAPGFFERNRDQMILSLVMMIVGGLLTKLLGF